MLKKGRDIRIAAFFLFQGRKKAPAFVSHFFLRSHILA